MKQVRGTNKKYIREIFSNKFNTINFEELYQLRQKFIEENIESNGIKKKKGLMVILNFLKSNNYKIAVASSSHEKTIKKYLEKLNILEYFDVIVGGDMVQNGKPDPEIYLKSIELLKIPKEQCIGIEDSINGILSVFKAGIKPVMIPDLEYPTEKIKNILYSQLDSLDKIIEIIKD